jgi:RNA polymerase sigma-70 factor (ECF subfamily)
MATLQEDPADILIRDQLARLHQEAIRQLPPQKRIIYTLSRDEELTYEEIAQKLHLSRNTVRNHMTDAIRSVRGYITGHTDLACLIIAVSLWQSDK